MYNMYGTFIVSELKKWMRDPLMTFMLFYPLFFGVVGRYLLPMIADASGFQLARFADLILVILTLLTPQMFGALIGFSILDDRDDHILTSIKVTPLTVFQFLSFRVVLVLFLTFIACSFVMWFSNIWALTWGQIFTISFLASLSAPLTGFFINALAQNKIEGFAMVKGSGAILLFPMIAIFIFDKKELFFSFAPGFWPAKAISSIVRGEGMLMMSYAQYIWIGLVYVLALNLLAYWVFMRKVRV